MLIYDHNKEFAGIDQESLDLLGYQRFEDLIHEHKDVAELFVKKPGYIHNFTNFPWIDFVMHAESDDAKVIIAGKKKAFSANIQIDKLYLSSAPQEEAFSIKLKNIQNYQLDASEQPEQAPLPFDIEESAPAQEVAVEPEEVASPTPVPTPEPLVEPEPQFEQPPLEFDDDIFLSNDTPQPDITPEATPPEAIEADEELEIFFGDEEPETPSQNDDVFNPDVKPVPAADIEKIVEDEHSTPMLGSYLSAEDRAYLADLKIDEDYVYDPNIAADELGLPVDLIEEFIGDFIKQAHEFKEQLFTAIDNEDFDNIKVLSHKLKGVAANLRIEDAFEVLRNINETSDIKECEANLKKFYITVAKLEGKDIEEVKRELEKPTDMYDLSPKFEPEIEPEIASEVEEKVEEELLPLDLPDLNEEEASAEPVVLDTLMPESEPEHKDDDDLYDFGLAVDDGNEPLMVLDDEEEIHKEIHSFDASLEEEEEEVLAEIQDFEEPEALSSEEAPVLTFDINSAAAAIGLGADLVGALIDDYIVEANEMKSKLSDVIEASDLVRSKGYATQLKGVSDNLRITEISDTLQKLITSSDKDQAKAAMQEFYGFINQL